MDGSRVVIDWPVMCRTSASHMAQSMTCAICLEDDAVHACECSAFHVRCFTNLLLRFGRYQCPTCHSLYDRSMMCAASGLAYTRTLGTFGPTHGTTMVRKLEHATALAKSSQGRRAKELFQEIIDSSPNPEWVLAVSEVELARVLKDGGELAAARDLLEKLVPRLLREKARWARHERIEASTLLGSIYVALKSWVDAEHWLFLSIDSHLANDTACRQKVVNCMEEIARFYRARGDNALACETYRVAVNILASDEVEL